MIQLKSMYNNGSHNCWCLAYIGNTINLDTYVHTIMAAIVHLLYEFCFLITVSRQYEVIYYEILTKLCSFLILVTMLVRISRPLYICIASALIISPPYFAVSSKATWDLPAPVAPNMTTIMGAKIVAVLDHVHSAARESKYTKNRIHKCYNFTLLRHTVANTCFCICSVLPRSCLS